jgi:hypothetical protein
MARNHQYRSGGGLGFARTKKTLSREYSVSVVVANRDLPFGRQKVEDMALGDVARELGQLQIRKDAKEFFSPALFDRFMALKRAYNRLSEG